MRNYVAYCQYTQAAPALQFFADAGEHMNAVPTVFFAASLPLADRFEQARENFFDGEISGVDDEDIFGD